MKRFLIMLCCGTMILGLVACGNKTSEKQNIEQNAEKNTTQDEIEDAAFVEKCNVKLNKKYSLCNYDWYSDYYTYVDFVFYKNNTLEIYENDELVKTMSVKESDEEGVFDVEDYKIEIANEGNIIYALDVESGEPDFALLLQGNGKGVVYNQMYTTEREKGITVGLIFREDGTIEMHENDELYQEVKDNHITIGTHAICINGDMIIEFSDDGEKIYYSDLSTDNKLVFEKD